MSVYDELRAEYHEFQMVVDAVTASEARGNASYSAPFDARRKTDWVEDMIEECADGMVYARAQCQLELTEARRSYQVRHKLLTLRDIERRLARTLRELCEIDKPWSPVKNP